MDEAEGTVEDIIETGVLRVLVDDKSPPVFASRKQLYKAKGTTAKPIISIQPMSDLHLEFEDKLQRKRSLHAFTVPHSDADVIVLAGDIGNKHRGIDFAYRTSTEHKKPVVYVAGNHEYYGSVMQHFVPNLRKHEIELQKQWPTARVHFLDNESVVINGVKFLGTTLWTSLGGGENNDFFASKLNDFKNIRYEWDRHGKLFYKKLKPLQYITRHERDSKWLLSQLTETKADPVVVVSHHPPHPDCIRPSLRGDLTNRAYASDYSELFQNIKHAPHLWISGHTHHACDFMVGRTRIVSNARGYSHEKGVGFDPDLVVSI